MKRHLSRMFYFVFASAFLLAFSPSFSQSCSTINFQLQSEIPSTCFEITMTMIHDKQDRPYMYVASKEGGFKIYDISDLTAPVLSQTIAITDLDDLQVTNLEQYGNYVYLALGNHFNNSQNPGMAIIDVTDPANAIVKDIWKHDQPDGGAGIVKTEGNYAYLGGMGHGLFVLDITDKTNIILVSQFVPDINYPDANPDPAKYNARGMEVKDDVVYLCYDAGGLRIIDVSDKQNPKETARFSNPTMDGKPRAYNNIVLDDSLAYIAVDYCGIEIINISDTTNLKLESWWNPWDCEVSAANWFSSVGHANELHLQKDCKKLFVSTGKSDLFVVDVSNPLQPDSCSVYGGVDNSIGTWGVGLHEDKIMLSYICAFIPFSSNWTGVKILTYDTSCEVGIEENEAEEFSFYPNPAHASIVIDTHILNEEISIYNTLGQKLLCSRTTSHNTEIDVSNLESGIYFLQVGKRTRKLQVVK